jgi:hypothetical protein
MKHTIITIDLAHIGPFDPKEEFTDRMNSRDSMISALDATIERWFTEFEDWTITWKQEEQCAL